MYTIIKSIIISGRYELADMLRKIDIIWLQGDISDAEKDELISLARENAVPENSYASLQNQIDSLYRNMEEMAQSIQDLRMSLESAEPLQEEYPAWVQPTGAHDAYNTKDKMTYTDGKTYICKMDGCVWGPDTYPAGWDLVKAE